MGMHYGVIATSGTATELLAALSAAGSFQAGRAIDSFDDAPETDAAGERTLIAGNHEGSAFLLDDSMVLSTDADLTVDASRHLDRLVMSVGAETTSGTYFLIAAEKGALRRLHWNLLGALPEPYDIGEALPGEPEDGLDDVDGRRLAAVLRAAGFDDDAWRERGNKFIVEASYGESPVGPVGAALNEWMSAHMPPETPNVKPVVAKREGGGFDIVPPGTRMPDGTRVAEKKAGGLLGKLFGRG